MKKYYERAEMEILRFPMVDIITSSDIDPDIEIGEDDDFDIEE